MLHVDLPLDYIVQDRVSYFVFGLPFGLEVLVNHPEIDHFWRHVKQNLVVHVKL